MTVKTSLERLRYQSLIVLVLLIFSCNFTLGKDGSRNSELNQEKISISFSNQTLREVIRAISKKTGYRIEVDKSVLDIIINGNFQDCSLDKLMSRVLKGLNLFILQDETAKTLIIRSIKSTPRSNVVVFETEDIDGSYIRRTRTNQHELDSIIASSQDSIKAFPETTYQEAKEKQKILDQEIVSNPELVKAEKTSSYQDLLQLRRELDKQLVTDPDSVQAAQGTSHKELVSNQRKLDLSFSNSTHIEASPGVRYSTLLESQMKLDQQLTAIPGER